MTCCSAPHNPAPVLQNMSDVESKDDSLGGKFLYIISK